MAMETINHVLDDRVVECFGIHHSRITPHTLRHYFVTRFLRSTGNIRLTQEAVGHSNIATTARYAHILDDEVKKAVKEAFG